MVANKKMLDEAIEKFNGKAADFTLAQIKYINLMFEKKGPVLVRMGIKKSTRFFSQKEWEEEKKYFIT